MQMHHAMQNNKFFVDTSHIAGMRPHAQCNNDYFAEKISRPVVYTLNFNRLHGVIFFTIKCAIMYCTTFLLAGVHQWFQSF